MTDLERVRECLYQYCNDCYFDEDSNEWGDCSCGGEVAKAGEDLDAHLKADAERSAAQLRVLQASEDELARLRDRERELSGKVKLAQDVALTWADGDNDAMQAALLGLFLRIYGQAPRNALKETNDAG